jgi:ubiquinone/menaquinone biosynthesis C-methylase UbiE
VQAFNERAPQYDAGRHGQLHHEISNRAVDVALQTAPAPQRVLDVGCGTGYALRRLAAALPEAKVFTGVDPAEQMVSVARESSDDPRLSFLSGTAERLPVPDASFDLVISTTSFDHWVDQRAGLAECARVLAPGGHLVLTDIFSALLGPTLLTAGRRDKARTRSRATRLVTGAGLRSPQWHRLYAVIIQTITAVK